jgi:hypothetical protein
VLDDIFKMIEAGRSSQTLTAAPVLVSSSKQLQAPAHARKCRFERLSVVECGTKFESRAMDMLIRIGPKLTGEVLDSGEDYVELHQDRIHLIVLSESPGEVPEAQAARSPPAQAWDERAATSAARSDGTDHDRRRRRSQTVPLDGPR